MEKQKNIPQLRFPEFEGEWEKKKLGEVMVEGKLGGNYENSEWNKGVPVIKMGNIGRGDINLSKVQYLPEEESFNEDDILNDGDLLFNTRNTLELVGKVSVWRKEMPFALYNSNIMRMKFNDQFEQTNRFLNVLFNTKKSIKQLRSFATGTTSVAAIYGRDLVSLKISYPSLTEQQKIASFFTAIDQKISQLKRKKTLLEQYKKGVMQKIFSQEVRFKGDNGQEFPKWEKKSLGEVLIEHKTVNSENKFDEVFSVAKHKGVINQIEHLGRSFSAKDISNYKIINPHDIVYTKSPTSDFPFGIIKQNLLGRSGVVSPLYGVFKPETNALGFLLHNFFLSWINTYNYLNPLVQKGAKNTMNINNDDFLNGARIPVPVSEFEQTKIANFLSSIDDKINHTQKQIEKVEVWKKGLMQQMFV